MCSVMAARSCLLCGKVLSRIWADKGEEFCSREHRNQYRLRRGMGRLMEANAVADVMRRREVPKQIPAGSLRSPGPASPRAFLGALRRPPAALSFPSSRLAGRPRLNAASRYRRTPPRAADSAGPRALPAPAKFPGSPASTPRIRLRLPAHVMPAPPAKARPGRPAPAAGRHSALRWRREHKPVVAGLLARARSRASAAMPESRPARRLTVPRIGRPLRVSTAAGFRVREALTPAPRFAGPQVHELAQPHERRRFAAVPPGPAVPMPAAIDTSPAAMRLPLPPGPNFERRFRWPGAFDIPIQFRNAANAPRILAAPFGASEDPVKERK